MELVHDLVSVGTLVQPDELLSEIIRRLRGIEPIPESMDAEPIENVD